MSGADLQSAELTFPCTQLTRSALKCGWVRSTAPVTSCHLLSKRRGQVLILALLPQQPDHLLLGVCLLSTSLPITEVQSEALGIQVPAVLDHKHSPL